MPVGAFRMLSLSGQCNRGKLPGDSKINATLDPSQDAQALLGEEKSKATGKHAVGRG